MTFAHQVLILLKTSNILPIIIPKPKISKVFIFKFSDDELLTVVIANISISEDG